MPSFLRLMFIFTLIVLEQEIYAQQSPNKRAATAIYMETKSTLLDRVDHYLQATYPRYQVTNNCYLQKFPEEYKRGDENEPAVSYCMKILQVEHKDIGDQSIAYILIGGEAINENAVILYDPVNYGTNSQYYAYLIVTARFDRDRKSNEIHKIEYITQDFLTDRSDGTAYIVCINSKNKIGFIKHDTHFNGWGENGAEFNAELYKYEQELNSSSNKLKYTKIKNNNYMRYEDGRCTKK